MEEKFEYIELEKIKVQKNNVRTQGITQGVDDLAKNIRANGLLQPIAAYFDSNKDQYVILTGQRRLNAYHSLNEEYPNDGYDKIQCKIIDEPESDDKKKALSLAENITQLPMSNSDLVIAVTDLYNKYNDYAIVEQKFGITESMITQYVRLARLPEELKQAIQEGAIHTNPKRSETAVLQAVDALIYTKNGNVPVETVIDMSKAIAKRELSAIDVKAEGKHGGTSDQITARIKKNRKTKTQLNIDLATDTAEKLEKIADSNGEDKTMRATQYVVDGVDKDYIQLGD